MSEWSPEVVVGEELARSLAGDRLPAFRDAPLRLLGEGWDSTVWLLGDEWVLRFPRREVVVAGFLRELDVLPRIAPLLPLAVPIAGVRGEPDARFPWPWSAHRIVPGREIPDARPDDAARVRHGRDLGRFLCALHAIDPAEASAGGELLPVDANRRGDMPLRVERTAERLRAVEGLGLWSVPTGLGGLLDDARALPPYERFALCHGDLHLRHLLVSDAGDLCGVIDWIDVCRADPAIDMPLYWGYLPPAGRAAFHAEYGPVEPGQLLRARVLAVFLWATLLQYAHDVGVAALRREALAGLDLAVAGL